MSDPEKPKAEADESASTTEESGAADGETRTETTGPWRTGDSDTVDAVAEAAADGDTASTSDPAQDEDTTTAAPADEGPEAEPSDGTLTGSDAPTDDTVGRSARSGLSLPARALIAVLLLLFGAAGGIAVFPWVAGQLGPWVPALQAETTSADRTVLEERLAALETAAGKRDSRLGDLDAGLEALRKTAVTLGQNDQRLEKAIAARPAGGGDAEALAALEDRVSALQQRIAGLARPATSPSESAETSAAAGGTEALQLAEQDLARLAGALDGLRRSVTARTDALAERLGAAEAALGAARARDQASAAVLALAQLRDSLTAGRPFAAELKTAEALSAEADRLAPLRAHAADGLGPLDRLVQDFAPVARAIVRAGQQPEGEDWVARTTARLGSLVTVRRVGDVAGEGVDARVARAEVRLTRGDLAGAVAQLDGLEGPSAEPAADWLARARERLSLARLVDTALANAIAAAGQG